VNSCPANIQSGPSAIYSMQKAQLLFIFVGATAFGRRFYEISPPGFPLYCFVFVSSS